MCRVKFVHSSLLLTVLESVKRIPKNSTIFIFGDFNLPDFD